jgi:hypothetical protein
MQEDNKNPEFVRKLKVFFRELRNKIINYLLIRKGRGPLTPSESITNVVGKERITGFEITGIIAGMGASQDLIDEASNLLESFAPEPKPLEVQSESIGGLSYTKKMNNVVPFIKREQQSVSQVSAANATTSPETNIGGNSGGIAA